MQAAGHDPPEKHVITHVPGGETCGQKQDTAFVQGHHGLPFGSNTVSRPKFPQQSPKKPAFGSPSGQHPSALQYPLQQ